MLEIPTRIRTDNGKIHGVVWQLTIEENDVSDDDVFQVSILLALSIFHKLFYVSIVSFEKVIVAGYMKLIDRRRYINFNFFGLLLSKDV